jgi:hypothetical protein
MAQRNDASDAGRKGEPHKTKQSHGYIYIPPNPKGHWLRASRGGTGKSAIEVDSGHRERGREVGNDDQ